MAGFSGQQDGVGQGHGVGSGKRRREHPFKRVAKHIEEQRGEDIKRVRTDKDVEEKYYKPGGLPPSELDYQNEIPDNLPIEKDQKQLPEQEDQKDKAS